MFYQIFLSPQVKRGAIISFKHGVGLVNQELSGETINRIYTSLYTFISSLQFPLATQIAL